MTKMSKAQRTAILEAYERKARATGSTRPGCFVVRPATLTAMVRNGWAEALSLRVGIYTTAGLIAAGVDMDAIHAEALREDLKREIGEEPGDWQAGIDAQHAEALQQNACYVFADRMRDADHAGALTEDERRFPHVAVAYNAAREIVARRGVRADATPQSAEAYARLMVVGYADRGAETWALWTASGLRASEMYGARAHGRTA
jgi:hypothetical protein